MRTVPASTVRWAAGPLSFELTSADAAVLTLAGAVFRPWATQDHRPPSCAWSIGPVHDDGAAEEWRVRSTAGADLLVPSPMRAVAAVEYGAVATIVESPTLITHGALVSWDGRGILIAGRGESGKSTLACVLWSRGAALLGDDVALVDPAAGEARPAPRRVSLRKSSRPLLGDAFVERMMRGPSSAVMGDSHLFHPDEIEPGPRAVSVPLAAIVFLARRGAAAEPARLTPIDPAHALLALLPYTNARSPETLGQAIRTISPLADRVPAFDLGRGPHSRMAEAVEALVASRNVA